MIPISELLAAEHAVPFANFESAAPHVGDTSTALLARGLSKSYGGLAAVSGMSLALLPGKIAGLIGPNGAGKTTLLNLLSGVERPDAGRILLAGRDVTGLPPHRLAAAGLVRTFQICRDLGHLTVLENLLVARMDQRGERLIDVLVGSGRIRSEETAARERARGILEQLGLWPLANASAETLSGGQKKLLELGRALMIEPSIVLLDEPAAGVAPAMERVLIAAVQSIAAKGTAVLIVEHDLDVVAALCEHVYVMAAGSLLVEGTFDEIARTPEVVDAYLGGVP